LLSPPKHLYWRSDQDREKMGLGGSRQGSETLAISRSGLYPVGLQPFEAVRCLRLLT
jgi:hypothetical protein